MRDIKDLCARIEDELSKIADSGRFNTSHVTLYQAAPMVKVIDCKFQYISCYSLSYSRNV